VKAFRCTLGQRLLQPANHFQKIFERQIWVQARPRCGNSKRAFRGAPCSARAVNFFQGEVVRPPARWDRGQRRKSLAVGDTNVGRIDVPVDVEISHVCRASFRATVIRQPANGQQIRRAVQQDAIIDRKPLAGKNFIIRQSASTADR